VTHVPLGTRLSADGQLRLGGEEEGVTVAGPPVETVILATGYNYAFDFLDEATTGLAFRGRRFVTPLYQHLLHATRPTLGFVGIPLAVPCPIPFFECQAAYLAEHFARPDDEPLASAEERTAWVEQRQAAVEGRPQDTHLTGAAGGSAWRYMAELLGAVHASRPPTADGGSWLERPGWAARLATVEDVYQDRSRRQPALPWHDDAYRRCQYSVDWASGKWSVREGQPAGVA